MRRHILVLLPLIAFSLEFFGGISSGRATPKAVEVTVAKKGELQESARLIGLYKARFESTLTAQASGILEHILVPEGTEVKKGQPVACLNNEEQKKRYQLAQHAAAIARAQFERAQKLYTSKFSSKKIVEDKRNAFISAEQALAASKLELDKTILYSPLDGIVGVFKMRQGSQVAVGDALVTIIQPSAMMVEFNIPEPLLPKVKPETKIFVNKHPAKLQSIQQCLDPLTHMAPALAEVTCKDCISGATVYVDVILEKRPNALIIPYTATFLKDEKPYVYVVAQGKAHLRALTLGMREKEQIEVRAGLKEGETIVIQGQERLYDGCTVHILQD